VAGRRREVPGGYAGVEGGAQQTTQPLPRRLRRWLRRVALSAAPQAWTKMAATFSWYLAEHSE